MADTSAPQKANDQALTDETLQKYQRVLDRYREIYAQLDEDQRLAATLVAFNALLGHLKAEEPFEKLVYERLGFNRSSYAVLTIGGGLRAATELFADTIEISSAAREALERLHALALQDDATLGSVSDSGAVLEVSADRKRLLDGWNELTRMAATVAHQAKTLDQLRAEMLDSLLRQIS